MDIFRDLKWLWLVIAMAGFVISGYFYWQAYLKLASAGKTDDKQKSRRKPNRQGFKQDPAAGRLITPPAEGKQHSLLTGLDDDPDDELDHDRTNTEPMDSEESQKSSSYAIDQGRTTKMSPKRPPGDRKTAVMDSPGDELLDAIKEAVEESLEEEIKSRWGIDVDEIGNDANDTATIERSGDTDDASKPESDAETSAGDEDADDPEARRKKRRSSQTEMLRKAAKHEELGLHVGIKPEPRVKTNELDDILARLDDALSQAPDEASTDSTASPSTEAPKQADEDTTAQSHADDDESLATTRKNKRGEPNEQTTAKSNPDKNLTAEVAKQQAEASAKDSVADAVAEDQTAEDSANIAAEPATAATQKSDVLPDDSPAITDGEPTTAATQRHKSEADLKSIDEPVTAPTTKADTLPDTTSDTAEDTEPEAASEAVDDQQSEATAESEVARQEAEQDKAKAEAEAEAEPAAAEADKPEAADTSKAADKAPGSSSSVPSWARADTFDDDVDGSEEPKQHSLFD